MKELSLLERILIGSISKSFDLSFNKISDKGASTIASNMTWKELEELNLSHNEIGDEGAARDRKK